MMRSKAEMLPRRRKGGGGSPARRAMVRWAWRLFRREWRQQLLIVVLITVAVAATVIGAGIATNIAPPANAGFGSANHLVSLPGSDPHLAADVAALRAHFGPVEVIENQAFPTGLAGGAQLRAQDARGPYGGPMLALLSGRYPAGPNDMAMTKELASTFNLKVGDPWQQQGRSFRLVGLVENPQNLLDNFALVAPGDVRTPSQVSVLFDASEDAVRAYSFPAGAAVLAPSSGIDPALIVLIVAVFGLVFIGLVGVASFTVLAQRRLRSLGLLSSLGATDKNVRLVMVANGAVVGVAAAVLGALVGLVAWVAYAPSFSFSVRHRVHWTHLPWWLVAAAIALAVLAAVLAARRPAYAVSRTPIVAALSGRPGPVKTIHRSALWGAGLLVIGLVLLFFSGGVGTTHSHTQLAVGGFLASAIGIVLFAPVTIGLLGGLARRAPISIRLALRDLVRYRARSGATLAAISMSVLIAMLVCLVSTGRYADVVDYVGPNLPANQLVLHPIPSHGSVPPTSPSDPAAVASSIATALGTHDVLTLEVADALLVRQSDLRGFSSIYVATPKVLQHYGIDPSSIESGTILITSRLGLDRTPGLALLYGPIPKPGAPGITPAANPKTEFVKGLPTGTAQPNLLITQYAVQKLGLQSSPNTFLITTRQPLTAFQQNTARQLAMAASMSVETKNSEPSPNQLRTYATLFGLLLSLGVLAMTVGLIRSETAGDLRTLTAVGAGNTTRRTLTGATAGALGLSGALLGTGVAYLATASFFRSQLSERMGHAPVLYLLLILIGLPVVASLGGWLFAGQEPQAVARQALE